MFESGVLIPWSNEAERATAYRRNYLEEISELPSEWLQILDAGIADPDSYIVLDSVSSRMYSFKKDWCKNGF